MVVITAGCSLQKKSNFNRVMQNLTAHYNILFNANEILRLKQISYATSFVDNYNEILSVYQDTTPQTTTVDKDLEQATTKANTIITIKEQSKYLGDAYLVLGKANYLEGNYYNAVEYFNYVSHSFTQRPDLLQQALTWKTRTLLYLDRPKEAKPVIDTAILTINPKKNRYIADIYAAKLQYDVDVQDYADGEEMANQAVQYCRDKTQRLRWTFILAQIEELNNKLDGAYKNYAAISRSNALFEMAFNASLNMIRIEDTENGVKINRIDKLLGLLKNPNNKEFKDQIYYQVAQLEFADKHIDLAIKYYNLSLRASIKNQSQKGLSYLRLAEIYFKNKADYLTSKKYYDSTLTALPPNYPGYQSIKKKGNNLQLLADRLEIIAREDTLQALARMDKKTRDSLIDKMVNDRILQQQAAATATAGNAAASNSGGQGNSFKGGSFYFDNATAVGQGYTDFKKAWGNRKLEDNWRRSNRSNSDIASSSANSTQGNDPDAPINRAQNSRNASTAGSFRKELVQGLPLTAALLAESNLRIYNAYVDIGNFYRDVMDDKPDAIATYEQVLRRFPDDPNRPAIYYNLYRLYGDVDQAKSDMYKNKLLKGFPDTPFAKIISDPEYAKKLYNADAAFTDAYNVVFGLYGHKEYKEVISCVPDLLKQYPNNKLSAQLYYLQTLAQGHFEKEGPFRDSLQEVAKRYPNDRLIVPLVTQHLAYIDKNQAELQARNVVLPDEDPQEVPFAMAPEYAEKANYRKVIKAGPVFATKPAQRIPDKKQPPPITITPKLQPNKPPVNNNVATKKVDTVARPPAQAAAVVQPNTLVNNSDVDAQPAVTLSQPNKQAINNPVVTAPSIFSMGDSTNYYFAVNVNSGTTNLASSRFGIGQFNRANYAGKGFKHQLKDVGNDDQVIYVGRFTSLEDAKDYARQIIPLLPDIMKVPKDKYSFFIITKENLDKLADKTKLDSYIDYYQNNF